MGIFYYLKKYGRLKYGKKIFDFLIKGKSGDHNSVKYWLTKYIKNTDSFIVQIGSNDGVTGDPIYQLAMKKNHCKVLLVEPVPYLFKKLKENYPDSKRFIFENVAINHGSKQTFYYVNKNAINEVEKLPQWYDQLGSFYKENITKHLDGVLESHIEEIIIEGISLKELLERNAVKSLDLLHIDTEGYDWKILSQLDLNTYKPTIILFEHKHLKKNEKNEAVSFLNWQYQIFRFNGDFLCLRKKTLKQKDFEILHARSIR